jgi:glutathione S-transferase
LGETEFIAGERFSIADITALCVVDVAGRIKMSIPEENKNSQRWYTAVSSRPSAAA